MTLRELRLSHYRWLLAERTKAADRRASRHTKETHQRQADFHASAVQTLDEYFLEGDTAPADHQLYNAAPLAERAAVLSRPALALTAPNRVAIGVRALLAFTDRKSTKADPHGAISAVLAAVARAAPAHGGA